MNVNEALLRERVDPFLTRETLGRVGAAVYRRPVAVEGARSLTGGCWNRVVAVRFAGELPDLVLKISPRSGDRRLLREHGVLRVFADRTRMPVPVPLLVDAEEELLPGTLLVMSRLPGRVMHQVFGQLPQAGRARVMAQLAAHVVELHEQRGQGFGGVELPAERLLPSWPEFWLPRFDAVLAEISASGLLPVGFLDQVARVRERFEPVLEIGGRSTLTHSDIWSGNVMIDGQGREPEISGFIDIPGFWADYARELSFMEMFGLADRQLYRRYEEVHALDHGFELRRSIYNLKMHLKHIAMYPGEAYYRRGAESCLRHVRGEIGG